MCLELNRHPISLRQLLTMKRHSYDKISNLAVERALRRRISFYLNSPVFNKYGRSLKDFLMVSGLSKNSWSLTKLNLKLKYSKRSRRFMQQSIKIFSFALIID